MSKMKTAKKNIPSKENMWPFWLVAVLVVQCDLLVVQCGHFGVWPFCFVAVLVVAVLVCGRFDQKPF